MTFESWGDLWKPELKGKLAAPDFDPSHLIVVSALLSGGDAATWEKGQAKLKELKPNFKAFYTNDANSQQLIANGETPVQVILSMNAHYMAGEGVPIQLVIPKEGAVLGIDTVAIMKGSKRAELAYKFINIAIDPQVQAEVAKFKKGSPVVLNAKLDPAVAKLPGVFTSGPYISRTLAGSFDKSVSSGTLACMRYAISYCAMRVSISGSPYASAPILFILPSTSSM